MLYSDIKTPSHVRMFYEGGPADGADFSKRYFFDRKTMKFFGDSMGSFGVKWIGGVCYLYRRADAVVNCFGTRRAVSSDLKSFGNVWRLDPKTYDLDAVRDDNLHARIYGYGVLA